jgi:hypothetical protein
LIGATLFAVVEVAVGARLPALSGAMTFVFLVAILILRPRGIAGRSFYA